jgi:hypothetical protein
MLGIVGRNILLSKAQVSAQLLDCLQVKWIVLFCGV